MSTTTESESASALPPRAVGNVVSEGGTIAVPATERGLVTGRFWTLAAVSLTVVLYWSALVELVGRWEGDPNYSHGYLVPFISLWLAWRGVGGLKLLWKNRIGSRSALNGIMTLAVGLLLHLEASFIGFLLLDVISLVLVLRGILWLSGGKRACRAYGFAIAFLVFMAPLPVAWQQPLAVRMQQMVSIIAADMLAVCDVPVLRDGYLLHLPGQTIEVAEACSGLRQLTAFLALSILAAGLTQRSTWFKVALVLLSAPIAIASNCLRIICTGFVLIYAGPEWAEGTFHTLEGVAVLVLGLALLTLVARALGAIEDSLRSRQTA